MQIVVDTGSAVLRSWARVVRTGRGESGEEEMVLGVSSGGRDLRMYLGGLVRGVLLLGHTEQASAAPAESLPDSVGQKLAQRVQQQVVALR